MPIEQSDIEEAKKILGKTAEKMSEDELRDQMVMMRFLIESWVDEYEQSVFNGKTLNELLGSL